MRQAAFQGHRRGLCRGHQAFGSSVLALRTLGTEALPYCWDCGEEIEFRYIDGRPTPIHIHGGWCSGRIYSDKKSSLGVGTIQIRVLKSYIDPNAICPVCGESVFFYQSPNGGRVFFDALGWPWPKHPCTDNSSSQRGIIKSSGIKSGKLPFKSRHGDSLVVYELRDLKKKHDRLHAKFYRMDTNRFFRASINSKTLMESGVNQQDFWDAPSFVMKRDNDLPDHRSVEFISARLQKILQIKMRLERG